ncbi:MULTISPECIES: hypothetical protein [unclassified Brevibacterium]|uniref:phage scaffolding protein n=1 Tax=unclassified Brevibacterium TaxID=2614124 RepID=UPI001E5DA79B|nr:MULTISPECIES: hypothetical protein [unclassified Brevibacterium]MCD1286492.1 hypothetical protein [Brevibacterium sp. CCUG 69071]MDK8434274.1 hypothetical protein [Brevibacterium sp. H-BE7]
MPKLKQNQDAKLVENSDEEDTNLDEDNSNENDQINDEDDAEDDNGTEDLGDKGKQALDRMKTARNDAKKLAKEREAEIAELKRQLAAKDNSAEENELENARAEARAEAITAANARVIRSEVKSAAAGKLRNPALAIKLLDLSDFDVDENGDVDTEQIQEAITELLEENPELAAQGGNASFDSGRGKHPRKKKLTKQDLAGMSPNEIAKAYDEGRVEA